MVNKLKNISDNQLSSTIRESTQQIWLAGLGAFSKAQQEGGKVFDALVREGETLQKKTKQLADDRVAAVAGRAADTWDRLEQVFEDRVARALASLGVPSKKEIDKLSKRVAELTAAVHALNGSAAAAAAEAEAEPTPARKRAPAKKARRA